MQSFRNNWAVEVLGNPCNPASLPLSLSALLRPPAGRNSIPCGCSPQHQEPCGFAMPHPFSTDALFDQSPGDFMRTGLAISRARSEA